MSHAAPPAFLDIAFEFCPEGAVVPEAVNAPVNLRRLEDESPPLAERHDFLHQLVDFGFSHKKKNLCEWQVDVKKGSLEKIIFK